MAIFKTVVVLMSFLALVRGWQMFSNLTDQSRYNKLEAPVPLAAPLMVDVSLVLLGNGNIIDESITFSFDLLLRTSWIDPRLAADWHWPNVSMLQGGDEFADRLWLPSLHIPNAPTTNRILSAAGGGKNPILVRVWSNGSVLVSQRLTVTGIKHLDHRFYPLDKPKIKFEIESVVMTSDQLQLRWSPSMARPVDSLAQFSWNRFDQFRIETRQTSEHLYSGTGAFSRLSAIFYLNRRHLNHILVDFYVPTTLLVMVTWGSFWIEITAAPARVTLGVTTMLTMVTMSRSIREKLPHASSIRALDIWIIVCIIFMFASIFEYVAANHIYYSEKRYYTKAIKHRDAVKRRAKAMASPAPDVIRSEWCSPDLTPRERDLPACQELALEIDRLSRIIFPVCFLLFNLVYWSTLCYLADRQQ